MYTKLTPKLVRSSLRSIASGKKPSLPIHALASYLQTGGLKPKDRLEAESIRFVNRVFGKIVFDDIEAA